MTSDEVYKLIEANGLTLHGDIEHFAELVAQHERKRMAWTQGHWTEYEHNIASAEREACAQLAQDNSDWYGDVATIADLIRARGQA